MVNISRAPQFNEKSINHKNRKINKNRVHKKNTNGLKIFMKRYPTSFIIRDTN
jgi:hypothetical protein